MMKDNSQYKRILDLYLKLDNGEIINTKNEADKYNVSTKTILRDINGIRDYIELKAVNTGEVCNIITDRKRKGFRLERHSMQNFSDSEILAICKILLDSRAFTKKEMDTMIKKLLNFCTPDENQKLVKELILNEQFHYTEPNHKTVFIDTLWNIGTAIKDSKVIEISYKKMSGGKNKSIVRKLKPLSIMFSEFYFYLIAFIEDAKDEINFEYKEAKFPTIYRIDRISDIKITNEHFKIPYKDRFEEGEFRKRIQFMYGGELRKIRFKCKAESLEAILDRLPTAKVLSKDDDTYTISAEVFGKGVDMWLRSQGERVKVILPQK